MSRRGPSLLVQTPAKLNLSLHVLGRRQDGYHDLKSLMVSIQLYDTLVFSPSESGRIEIACQSPFRGPPLPCDERNLVVRAAQLLRAAGATSQGVSIRLIKRIPLQAGLGGGSSDAAATLAGLNFLWQLGFDAARLHDLAARLGSDVNFFLDSRPAAVCSGRGEQVQPVPLRTPLWFVVVKPSGGLSTADVFRELQLPVGAELRTPDQSAGAPPPISAAAHSEPLWRMGGRRHNDLEPVAARLSAEVSDCMRQLESCHAVAWGMTGSGTACFALCRSRRQATALAGRLRGRQSGAVFVASAGV